MIGAVNYFNDQTNSILNQLTGTFDTVPRVARAYRDSGSGSAVVGEENFGEGSSREHAAMEPRFLGVKVVLVKSFARIHETNLKKQGVLTLTFMRKDDYDKIKEDDRIDVTGLAEFTDGSQFTITLTHTDGTKEKFLANHSYNESQIEWFKEGSALNIIRKSNKKNV
jgi:aconitate hydratase